MSLGELTSGVCKMNPQKLAKKYDKKVLEEALRLAKEKDTLEQHREEFVKKVVAEMKTNRTFAHFFHEAIIKVTSDRILIKRDMEFFKEIQEQFMQYEEVKKEVNRLLDEFIAETKTS